MTTTTRRQFPRQREIRKALRWEYAQGAVNEMHVANLKIEMNGLPHDHLLNADKMCAWCFYGTDEYSMPKADVLAKTAQYEKDIDEFIAAKVFGAKAPVVEKVRTDADLTTLYFHYTRHGGPAATCKVSPICGEAFNR